MTNDGPDGQRGIIQFVMLDQSAADAVIVSGWSKADKARRHHSFARSAALLPGTLPCALLAVASPASQHGTTLGNRLLISALLFVR